MTLYGIARTKKNSQNVVNVKRGGRDVPVPLPSPQFKQWEKDCLRQITAPMKQLIETPVNICCVFYMPTRRRVDSLNLLEAIDDILVKAGVLMDDNCAVACSHDGSVVFWDKDNPRVEITITPREWSWDYYKTHAMQGRMSI